MNGRAQERFARPRKCATDENIREGIASLVSCLSQMDDGEEVTVPPTSGVY